MRKYEMYGFEKPSNYPGDIYALKKALIAKGFSESSISLKELSSAWIDFSEEMGASYLIINQENCNDFIKWLTDDERGEMW